MSQSRSYRLFFKKLTNIRGRSISSSQLRVQSFTINRDLLTRATSTFNVLEVPSAIEIGDIVGMYDDYGTILFLGIVEYLESNTIQAGQMYSLFNDNWLWNNPNEDTIEQTILAIITNDFRNSDDELLSQIFWSFSYDLTTETEQKLQSQEPQYVVNFANFLYDIYEKYSIFLDFDIKYQIDPLDSYTYPTIRIGRSLDDKLTLANNNATFRNFDIIENVYETNKLVIYSEETGEYRATFYGTSNGITEDSSALGRPQKIKTNIIFSDDNLNILKASSLRTQMLNHEITCEMVLDNKLLSINDLKLGREVDIYYNNQFFNTVLTGYTLRMIDNIDDGVIKLKFGLVRTNLTTKLFKRLANEYAS